MLGWSKAGGSCEVLCKYPYTGVPGEATCPEVNTQSRLPILRSPSCMVATRRHSTVSGYRGLLGGSGGSPHWIPAQSE